MSLLCLHLSPSLPVVPPFLSFTVIRSRNPFVSRFMHFTSGLENKNREGVSGRRRAA